MEEISACFYALKLTGLDNVWIEYSWEIKCLRREQSKLKSNILNLFEENLKS